MPQNQLPYHPTKKSTSSTLSHEMPPLYRPIRHSLHCNPSSRRRRSAPYLTLLALLSWPVGSRGDHTLGVPMASSCSHSRHDRRLQSVNANDFKYEPHTDPLRGINLDRLLVAISDVESGSQDTARGIHGERGRFQFRPKTWAMYGYGPFTNAHEYAFARIAAVKYLHTLARILLDHGRHVTIHDLAQLWNRGSLLEKQCDFADRVNNLYQASCQPSQISSPRSHTPPAA